MMRLLPVELQPIALKCGVDVAMLVNSSVNTTEALLKP